MSYQEQNDLYRNVVARGRIDACVREQALLTYTGDADPANAALASGVAGGNMQDIDAVIAGVCFGPNWADVADDGALLSAVQSVWPTVASARYGSTA